MTVTLTPTIKASITGPYNSSRTMGTVGYSLNLACALAMASGTGANQADRAFDDQRTLAASGSEDLDLAGGLTDALGQTLTFVKVKAILVFAAAGNTNNVEVGPAAANGFAGALGGTTPKISIPPGGWAMIAAPVNGWSVTAGTGDLLHIANSGAGTGVTYQIIIIGTSA